MPRGPEAQAFRVSLLQKTLEQAAKDLEASPRDTAMACYDVVSLYGSSAFSELSEALTAAQKLLRKLPRDLARALPPLPAAESP